MNDGLDNILHVMKKLQNEGMPIWLYIGTDDWKIPLKSTRLGINQMNLNINKEWRAWVYNCHVASWVETYHEGLTVRGAKLHNPLSAPKEALFFLENFSTAE
ncbi:hypothetical protein ACFE04_030510 [Oxalis oulophora]